MKTDIEILTERLLNYSQSLMALIQAVKIQSQSLKELREQNKIHNELLKYLWDRLIEKCPESYVGQDKYNPFKP